MVKCHQPPDWDTAQCDNMAKMGCVPVPKTSTLPPHISFTSWHPGPQKILVRFLQEGRFVGWLREKLSELLSNGLFMFLGRKLAKIEGKQYPNKWSRNGRSYYRAGLGSWMWVETQRQEFTSPHYWRTSLTPACTSITNNDYVRAEWRILRDKWKVKGQTNRQYWLTDDVSVIPCLEKKGDTEEKYRKWGRRGMKRTKSQWDKIRNMLKIHRVLMLEVCDQIV